MTRREEGHEGMKDTKGGRTRGEEGHKEREEGERHYGLPQQRRRNHLVSREEHALPHRWTRKEEVHEGRKDTGQEGRKDTKRGRTKREDM